MDPNKQVLSRYWINLNFVKERTKLWNRNWLLSYRDITSNTSERTSIFTIIPYTGIGHTGPVIFLFPINAINSALFLSCVNSLTFDFLVRQKIGGAHLSFGILNQIPIPFHNTFSDKQRLFIVPRVAELVSTSWDIQNFCDDIWRESFPELQKSLENQWNENAASTNGGHSLIIEPNWYQVTSNRFPNPPFKWDESRRALLRAELDAYYARLYGLNRKQLRYILDPADLTPRELEDILDPWEEVADPLNPQGYAQRAAASDFPGETFRVLKEKEIKLYGEYRTRRLVLEAWERLSAAGWADTGGATPLPQVDRHPEPVVEVKSQPVVEPVRDESKPVKREEPEVKEETPMQPALSDFGLYKCSGCGKMVMGFEKEKHEKENHSGNSVGWKKMR